MRLLAFAVAVLCATVCSTSSGDAAETGSSDYFRDAAVTWPANPGYKVTQAADGVATMRVNKQVMWAAQNMLLAQPCDISAHPYLSVQVKTSGPMVLDVYLLDGKTAVNLSHRIRPVDQFQTYGYDFSSQKIDLHHIVGFLFCVNGAANSWDGVVDLKQLAIGEPAKLLPDIEAVEDQEWYHDTGAHAVLLTGISHVQSFSLSGAERLLRQVTFSPITAGHATMSYELIPGATGTLTATLTATGDGAYAPVTRTFHVLVEANLPPTIDVHAPVTTLATDEMTICFTGISDGNATADQPLKVSVKSSNQAVLEDQGLQATNPNGGRYLYVRGTPKAPGDTTLTLLLDDQSGGASTLSSTVAVHAVASWNHPPTLAPIADVRVFVSDASQTITLTGIADGDGGKQHLTFTAVSSDSKILPDPSVSSGGGDTATLHLRPTATPGQAKVTVTVTDDGGNANNNGNQSVSQVFTITTRVRPVSAYTAPLADFTALKPLLRAEDGVTATGEMDGATAVMHITCKDKSTYSGLWLTLPDMDLSGSPYLSVDVKCDQKIGFNLYFYDGDSQRNDGASRTTAIGGPGSDWKTITFDFSGKGQMSNAKSVPINSHWVTTALFNFHPTFTWPFSNWSGELLLRNLRIGTAADVVSRNPPVMIGPVPAQVLRQGSGVVHLMLSGLSVANQQPIDIKATETGTAMVTPTLGAILNGACQLDLTAGQAGRSTVTLSATAANADPASITFTVDVVDPGNPAAVTIDAAKTFQTIRGFGTFYGPEVGMYTEQLGASVMRIGDECDFNPRRDTSDLHVLNRARLNYQAFNFDYFKKMKAAGVETFFFTAWTPPAWQKANFSTNYMGPFGFGSSDECLNRLDYDHYEDYAKTLVAVVRMFQEEAGITLDAISLQNEPSFCEPYGSGILDPAHMVHLIDVVGPRFAQEGIPTRILMPEQVFTQASMLDYIRVLNADPEAQKYGTIIATHGYDDKGVIAASPDFPGWSNMFKLAQQGTGAKELWMSETSPTFTDWSSAMNYSMTLYGSLEYGNISLWTQWDIEGTLLDHNLPNDSFWVVRQYWKFIRPGAKRLSSSSANPAVFVTSYLNDAKHGGKLISVLTNHSAAPAMEQLSVAGHPVASWQVIMTDPVRHSVVVGEIKAGEVLLLPPNSVTTVVEQ